MKSICLLIFLLTLSSCNKKYTGEVRFKSCIIKYDVLDEEEEIEMDGDNMIGNQWRFESAKKELALCLCEKYLQNQDKEIKEKIFEIYYDDFEYYPKENRYKPVQFDFILKNRKEIFDYRILAD